MKAAVTQYPGVKGLAVLSLWSSVGGDGAVAGVKLGQLKSPACMGLRAARLPICREPGQSYAQTGA